MTQTPPQAHCVFNILTCVAYNWLKLLNTLFTIVQPVYVCSLSRLFSFASLLLVATLTHSLWFFGVSVLQNNSKQQIESSSLLSGHIVKAK